MRWLIEGDLRVYNQQHFIYLWVDVLMGSSYLHMSR
jgi:hypothetical protein